MKFPKQIIDEFVSWIDFKDIHEYVNQIRNVSQQENSQNIRKVFTNYVISTIDISSIKTKKIYKTIDCYFQYNNSFEKVSENYE